MVMVAPNIAAFSQVTATATDFDDYDVTLEVVAVPAVGDRAGRFVCRARRSTNARRAAGHPGRHPAHPGGCPDPTGRVRQCHERRAGA